MCARVHVCASPRVGGGAWPREGLFSMRAALLALSMEVGVCVEAYRQEAETHRRHINSAFMTFVVLDANDQPQMLPWIRPQPGVSQGRTLPPTSSPPSRPSLGLALDRPWEQWAQACPSAGV